MTPHAQQLDREDCLLLLVDHQASMLDRCPTGDKIKHNTAALIDAAGILDIPIIFSVQYSARLGGIPAELLERVDQPRVFDKMEFGCFGNPDLKQALSAAERKTILLSGAETHICIMNTGVQALNHGFKLHVAADAVGSPRKLDWQLGLRRLEQAGAVISTTGMVIFELLNRAGTPEFKQAMPVLKGL